MYPDLKMFISSKHSQVFYAALNKLSYLLILNLSLNYHHVILTLVCRFITPFVKCPFRVISYFRNEISCIRLTKKKYTYIQYGRPNADQ